MSSVSCVASTAPWPGRAWSEWPCVITARSTGPHRVDMEAAGLAAEAGGNGHQDVLRAHARLYRRSVVEFYPSCAGLTRASILELMPARLFLSSGDLMADRRFEFRARSAIEGRSARRRRSAVAGDRAGAEFHLGLVHARRYPRTARRARGGDCGLSKGAGQRSRRPPRRRASVDAAWRRARVRHAAGLCANAVRSICAAVRSLAGGRSRLSRSGAVVQGRAVGARGRAQARLLQARHRSRLRHRAGGLRLRQRRSIISSASICRRA